MDNKNHRDRLLRDLESVLHNLIQAHEAFGTLLKLKRQALADAEHDHVMQLLEQENAGIQTISSLEKNRLQLVGELTLAIEPDAREPMRMRELAGRLDEPARGRLLVLRKQVRDRMLSLQKETGVARRATETLISHMQGLAHTLGSVCLGAGVYERPGTIPSESAALSTFHTTA